MSVLALSLVFCGSGDGCQEGDSSCHGALDPRCTPHDRYCDGDEVVECQNGHPISTTNCRAQGVTCTAINGYEQCAASSEPDPRCAGTAEAYCSGPLLVECSQGFVTSRVTCDPVCVERFQGAAMCALSTAKDPRCAASVTGYCDSNSKVVCREGYATEAWACATCTAAGPDARCFAADGSEVKVRPE